MVVEYRLRTWKLQKPLMTSDPADANKVLAYRGPKKLDARHIDLTPELDLFFGNAMKIYVHAGINAAGLLVIKRRVSDKPW